MKKCLLFVLTALTLVFLFVFSPARPVRADIGLVDIAEITENSVTIRWDRPSYPFENVKAVVTGYKVYYGTSADKLQQYGKKLSASATKRKITGLASKKKYYFQIKVGVKFVNQNDEIQSRDVTNYLETPISVITLPGKISNLLVTSADLEERQVVFKWTAVNPNSKNYGYQYYVKTSGGKKKASGKVTTNGVRLKNITNTGYYLGKARSYCKITNREGTKYFYGEWSDWVPIMSDPMIINAGLPDGRINVTWSEMKGVDGYDIYLYKNGWKKMYKASYTSTGATSGTIMKVNGKSFKPAWGTEYWFYIVARKSFGGKNYYSPGNHYVPLSVG